MTEKLTILIAAAGLAIAPALAVCPLADPADCVYVDVQNCVAPGTGTQADPFCSIQSAYDFVVGTTTPDDHPSCIASPGAGTPSKPNCRATILVLPGTYQECVDASSTFDPDIGFNDDRPVRFVADAWLEAGSPNPDPADTTAFETVALMTTITGLGVCDGVLPNPRQPGVSMAGTGAAIHGFAVTMAGAAGLEGRGPVDFSNNLLIDNEGELGGGIQLITAVCAYGDVVATIRNNVVRDNLADDFSNVGNGDGGGIFVRAEGLQPDFDCAGGQSDVTVADNVVTGNTAQNVTIDAAANDVFAGGGGISVETETDFAFVTPENSSARVLVYHNNVFGNTVITDAAAGFAFGGGIFASTLGFGMETLEISHNTVGPNNLSATANGGSFGGGISLSVAPLLFGLHEATIYDNSIFQNAADIGGGMDLLAIAEDLDNGQRVVVNVSNNSVDGNASVFEGGGLNAEYNSLRSLDVEEEATYFPTSGAPLIAEELTFRLSGNLVTGNTSGTAGAGAVLRPSADADPFFPDVGCFAGEQRPAVAIVDFAGNFLQGNTAQSTAGFGGGPGCSDPVCEAVVCSIDSFCCDTEWDQLCADEAVNQTASCDCAASDCCVASAQTVIGAGVLVIPVAKGESLAKVHMSTSTLVGNQMTADGFVGGVEIASVTQPDCFDNFLGSAELEMDRCIVANNHADGIGGPPFSPGVNDLTINVTRSSVFGNGDSNVNNDPDLDYEDTIFPGGVAPPGNILDDPLLDPATFVPGLCSCVYKVGSLSNDPSAVCTTDAGCTLSAAAPGGGDPQTGGGGICVAEGAGYLASPDINGDDAVDGVDLVRFSLAFGAEENVDARYNPGADINRDGQIDGGDLPLIAPLFGQECVP